MKDDSSFKNQKLPLVRHLNCEYCEKAKTFSKKQGGITLHLVRFIKTEGNTVLYATSCCVCMVKINHKTNMVIILKEVARRTQIRDWEALLATDPEDDGYEE